MVKNKILIGVVTAKIKDYCWSDFKSQLKWLENKGFDIYIVDNSQIPTTRGFKSKWIKPSATFQETTLECMNEVRSYFLKGKYERLWILESDVFINEEGLERLLKMEGDVCNLTYSMNLERFNGEVSLCIQATDMKLFQSRMVTPDESRAILMNGVVQLGVAAVDGKVLTHTGYGCTIINRNVVEKIPFRLGNSNNDKKPFPDSFFHLDVLEAGYKNLLDTDYLPSHRNLSGQTMKAIQKHSALNRQQRRQLKK
jgi:hypothetical protein